MVTKSEIIKLYAERFVELTKKANESSEDSTIKELVSDNESELENLEYGL
jgi:hypothetical protein